MRTILKNVLAACGGRGGPCNGRLDQMTKEFLVSGQEQYSGKVHAGSLVIGTTTIDRYLVLRTSLAQSAAY